MGLGCAYRNGTGESGFRVTAVQGEGKSVVECAGQAMEGLAS